MLDLGTQLLALLHAVSCLEHVEEGLFVFAAVLILWMARHVWLSTVSVRRD